MILAERTHLRPSTALSDLCHRAKNFYNLANWYVRQDFFFLGNVLSYYDLNAMTRRSDAYRELPAQTAQQVLRQVAANWKSFFRASAEYRRSPGKFLGPPRPPRYKAKDGECVAVFTRQQCRVKGNYIYFPKKAALPALRTRVAAFREVRVVPQGTHYVAEVLYEQAAVDLELDKGRALGVDLGVNNLVTAAGNAGVLPFVVKGGVPKSVNQ